MTVLENVTLGPRRALKIDKIEADGLTMVLATHEMGFARDVANRVAFLLEGRGLETGPPDQLFSETGDTAYSTSCHG